mgnify:CR=1 FL=1
MDITVVQLNITWKNKAVNIKQVELMLRDATIPSSGLIVLPEMFSTGFTMDVASVSEQNDSGETLDFLKEQANRHQSYIIAGVVTTDINGLGNNEAILVNPEGEVVTRYCKIHPFSYGGEDKHYRSGSTIETYPIGEYLVAPLICYDLRFPETFRSAVHQGATVFPVIANWPAARDEHWTTLLKARAIENQAYVIGANRCGADPKIQYAGHSMIINPKGEVIAEADNKETLLQATLDFESLESYRDLFPTLKDIK